LESAHAWPELITFIGDALGVADAAAASTVGWVEDAVGSTLGIEAEVQPVSKSAPTKSEVST